jgi:hypothetical protein
MKVVYGQHLIPNRDALEAIEPNLGRTRDRLDRLQRRRKGEPVPPSVNLRLME